MIVIYTGGIGQGKTLSVVKDIIDRKNPSYTNFDLNKIKNITRLKVDHLFKEDPENNKKKTLNYDYWRQRIKKGGFDIYLDEFHNIMNSRRSMSKTSVLMSDWLSQIRKILGDSEKHNLYLLTQKLKRIDVNSRDLATIAIKCEKQQIPSVLIPTEVRENGKLITKRLPLTIIYKRYFRGSDALNNFEEFGVDKSIQTTRFIANPYYKFFNSYELVEFGSEYI